MIDVTFTAVTKVIIAVFIGAFSSGSIPFVMSTMTDFGFLISAVLLPALTIVNTGRSIDLEVLIECSILVVMQIVFSIVAAVFGYGFQKIFFDVHHQRSAKDRNRHGVSGNFQPHITFRLKYEDAQERAARELVLAKRKESSSSSSIFDGSAPLPLFREETEEASGDGEMSSSFSSHHHHHHHHHRRGGTRSSPSSSPTTTPSPTSLRDTGAEAWQRSGSSPTHPAPPHSSSRTEADARPKNPNDPLTKDDTLQNTPAPLSSRQKGVPYVGIRMSHALRATGVLPEEVLPYIAAPDRDTDYIVGYAWICYVAFVLLNTVTLPLPLIESLAQSMWWVDFEKGSSYVFVYSIPAAVLAWTLGPFLVKKAKSETKKRKWMRWLLEEHLIQARLTDAATQFSTTLSSPSSSPLGVSFPEKNVVLDAALAAVGKSDENTSLPHSKMHRCPSPAPTRYPTTTSSASPYTSSSSSSSLVGSSSAGAEGGGSSLLFFSRVQSAVTCCWCKRYGYDWQQSGLLRFLPTSAKEGEDDNEEDEDDDDEDDEDEEDERNAEGKQKGSFRESEERNAREYVPFSHSAGTSVASSSSSSESHGHAEHKSNEEEGEEEEEETHQKGKPKKRSESPRRRTTTRTTSASSSRMGTSSRRKEKWRSLTRAIGRECSQLLRNPPFLSIGIGMLLGLVPPLHRAFFVNGPLEVITDSLVLIAQGNIPASLLLLGANLAGTKQLTLGGGDEDALVEGDDGKMEEEKEEKNNNNTTMTSPPNAKKKKAPHRKQRERVRAEKELLMRAGVRLRHGGSTQLRHAGTSTDEDEILLQALENEADDANDDDGRKEPSNDNASPAWRTVVTTTTAGEKCTTAFRAPRWKRHDGTPAVVEVGKTTRFPVDSFSSPVSDGGAAASPPSTDATHQDGQKRGRGVVRVLSFSSSPSSPLPQNDAKNNDDDEEDTTFTVRWKYNAEGKRICQYPDSMGYRVAFSSAAEEEEEKIPPRSSNFLSSFLQELQGMVSLTGVSHRFVFGVIFFRLLVIPFFFFLLLVFLVKAFPFLFGGRGREDVTLVLTLFVEVAAPTAINSTIMFAMENFMTYHWAKMLFLQYILSIGSVVLWTFLGLKFTETLVPGNERLEGLLPSL